MIIEICQIRWTIEVFFKEESSFWDWEDVNQMIFDAQIADNTITMIQHIVMPLKYRFEHHESKAVLLEQLKEDIIQAGWINDYGGYLLN
ncbi:MAG: hypothetical protein R6U04_00255 [Bacteroidales bacterium]